MEHVKLFNKLLYNSLKSQCTPLFSYPPHCFVPISESNAHKLSSFTKCFTDLGKLNFLIVARFQAQANLQYCPSCIQKLCLIQMWLNLTQK